jgi:hypothetical protein
MRLQYCGRLRGMPQMSTSFSISTRSMVSL